MGKFNPRPWALDNEEKRQKVQKEIKDLIWTKGLYYHDKVIHGRTDVIVHEDGTATVFISNIDGLHEFKLRLYEEGIWEIIE